MNITIAAFGTHGDVQPLAALGKGLQAAGHSVRLVVGTNFVPWVRTLGLDAVGTFDVMAFMQSAEGLALAENPRRQVALLQRVLRERGHEMTAPLVAAAQDSDLMLSGFTSDAYAQMACEKYGVRQISLPLQPYRRTRSGSATLMTPFPRRSSVVNAWIGSLFAAMLWSVTAESANALRASLGLPPHTTRSYTAAARGTPAVCGFSRHVVPPPPDWGADVQVAGYWFLDPPADYAPPPALAAFLAAGDAPVYVGFGSMAQREPEATFRLVCDALERAGQRGIVLSGWGGAQAAQVPAHVCLLDSVPHAWLFPRMAGVVHHGGAGTTAAGLRAGVPSLLVPHSADQPYWARRLDALGVSARALPRKKLTVDALARGVRALVRDAALRERAARFRALIRAEQGVTNAVAMIEAAARG